MKHLRRFDTTSEYESYTESAEFVTPNVSLCKDTRKVEYNRYVAPETRVVAKHNVTDTSKPTPIGYRGHISGFSAIEIDGVELPNVVSAYTFSTTGEHTVKYTLADPTTICAYAFTTCWNLTSITIPNTVTSIGNNAFYSCPILTSVDIPNSITSIGEYAFYECVSITSITIPNSVITLDDSAFYRCSGLTSIDIPDSVTTICDGAFAYCSGLTSCTIGSGVTSIGALAFKDCSSLTSITSNATTAPTIQNNTFIYIKTGGTLYVPNGSSGYDTWMQNANYYLGLYGWTKVEQ